MGEVVSMFDKLWFLIPEFVLFVGAVVVSIVGLSRNRAARDTVPLITCMALITAFVFTPFVYSEGRVDALDGALLLPMIGKYVKMTVCAVGIGLVMLSVGLIDRRLEHALETGQQRWDPIRLNRGEYFAFFLLSLIGVMLCCNANDLIWLFLALELTSLPTYIMVAISRGSRKAQEAAVKYFFLGAMAAAMFLFGFAFLYGATGTLVLTEMRDADTRVVSSAPLMDSWTGEGTITWSGRRAEPDYRLRIGGTFAVDRPDLPAEAEFRYTLSCREPGDPDDPSTAVWTYSTDDGSDRGEWSPAMGPMLGTTGLTVDLHFPDRTFVGVGDEWNFVITTSHSPLLLIGLVLAILGVSFKIAAVPMHMYAPDVYEGAAAPVTAFLAFVPKAAGMVALILLLSIVGWSGNEAGGGLPFPIAVLLSMVAILTMTLGNIGALLQRSVKRVLAYSSIAHSGYMLLGVIAGPGLGVNAVLFYLLAYGIMNTAAFAVLASLERRGEEIESLDDLAGLRHRHPAMAMVMAVAAGSLLGVPPLLGFIGKLYLFIAAVDAGLIKLVVIAGLNSAISAWYYLRLIGLPLLSPPNAQSETIVRTPSVWPRVAAMLTVIAILILPLFSDRLIAASRDATATEALADAPEAPARAAAATERH